MQAIVQRGLHANGVETVNEYRPNAVGAA